MIEYDVLSFNGEEEKKTTIKRKWKYNICINCCLWCVYVCVCSFATLCPRSFACVVWWYPCVHMGIHNRSKRVYNYVFAVCVQILKQKETCVCVCVHVCRDVHTCPTIHWPKSFWVRSTFIEKK
jgi:hypothetical protein